MLTKPLSQVFWILLKKSDICTPLKIDGLLAKSIFSISLDFELHWGIFDNVPLNERHTYFNNTLDIIPEMLSLFEKHKIEVTWATVGMLFNLNSEKLRNNIPHKLPSYVNKKLSAYRFIDEQMFDDSDGKYYMAPALIDLINNTLGQEIGTHTYSHYYALEKGQTLEQFKSDLDMANTVANDRAINLSSIVFPRNQFNHKYLDACKEAGIRVVRENPKQWMYSFGGSFLLLKKVLRTLDCYLPLFRSAISIDELKINNSMLIVPSSRLLRPVKNINILDLLRIGRIKKRNDKLRQKWKILSSLVPST